MTIIDCEFASNCASFNQRCEFCANNKNAKRDYYTPIYPYPYTYPWTWPWYQYTWCTSGGTITLTCSTTEKTDYFTQQT